MAGLLLVAVAISAQSVCVDDAKWDNHSGKSCADYSAEGWCNGHGYKPGKEWTGGEHFNWPERNCCACKQPAPAPAPAPMPAPVSTFESATSGPTSSALSSATTAAPHAKLGNDMPIELADAVQARLASCPAPPPGPPSAEPLFVFARLPRTGSGLMCQLLSTCAARQSRGACGTSPSSTIGAGGGGGARATGDLTFFGSDKLPSSNYGMCAGLDGLTAACSTLGGEMAAVCQHMGTLKRPGAIMVAMERWPDWTLAPCPSVQPAVRLLALLRDPGERAQSAYTFQLDACVCNFKFQWCTMFTSFRFKNRQTKLCDEHTPRHGFAAAIGAVRAQGNMPWPLTSSETQHVLGRFTAGIVKEVYTPWFGAYQAAGGGGWKSSALLAGRTLASCFAWVGIAEDLALSLQLLKLELPDHFGKLDVSQHAWTPSSGASGGNLPAANQSSQHPYLRSHLLPHDYEVFDAERRRLFQRARAHGILLYNAPLV
jgi:hypothetical protein